MARERILVVDDEAGVRESLRMILGEEYTLAYATNGEEALEQVKLLSPDLVIMDIKMPKMDGLEALPQIKRVSRSTPVIMITGYESSDVAAQAIKLGADDYFTKPFDREKVCTQVKTLLAS